MIETHEKKTVATLIIQVVSTATKEGGDGSGKRGGGAQGRGKDVFERKRDTFWFFN